MSGRLRQIVAMHPEAVGASIPISPTLARELLDGTTDTMVVVAGMSITAGLPGPTAYVEVVGSNLSKANPDSGKIDLDLSGKWIKGRDFVKPDLTKVLANQERHIQATLLTDWEKTGASTSTAPTVDATVAFWGAENHGDISAYQEDREKVIGDAQAAPPVFPEDAGRG
jgi:hypothetical protein